MAKALSEELSTRRGARAEANKRRTQANGCAREASAARQSAALELAAQVLESTGQSVCLIDRSGVVRGTTSAFNRMFGYQSGELPDQAVCALNGCAPEQSAELIESIFAHTRHRAAWSGKLMDRCKDGTVLNATARVALLRIGGKPYLVAVHAADPASQVDAAAAELAALAHELNQPLAAISNYARGAILRIESGTEPAVLRDVIQKIAAQALRAGDVVHRVQSALLNFRSLRR